MSISPGLPDQLFTKWTLLPMSSCITLCDKSSDFTTVISKELCEKERHKILEPKALIFNKDGAKLKTTWVLIKFYLAFQKNCGQSVPPRQFLYIPWHWIISNHLWCIAQREKCPYSKFSGPYFSAFSLNTRK